LLPVAHYQQPNRLAVHRAHFRHFWASLKGPERLIIMVTLYANDDSKMGERSSVVLEPISGHGYYFSDAAQSGIAERIRKMWQGKGPDDWIAANVNTRPRAPMSF